MTSHSNPIFPHVERDGCGVGFIADIQGRRRHAILRQALEALANLAHRGAVGADGLTSDGSGLLTQLPRRLIRKVATQHGGDISSGDRLGVGVFFFPRLNQRGHEVARSIVEEACRQSEVEVVTWREVPIGPEVLGPEARRRMPPIHHLIVRAPAGIDGQSFERRLYIARRRVERAARAKAPRLYTVSWSHRTIVYKAMVLPGDLARFYPDLEDSDFRTALALFHLRFSTNTLPNWRLAQPFRMLGHNGEINTIQGNAHWMAARERELTSSVWGGELGELLPVLQEEVSDSAMLDNALEFLVHYGRDPLHSMMMLLPEASRPGRDPKVKAFFDFHSTLLEPWDGPAAVVFSDGRYAAAALDRNGLRPQRYWVTDDDLVILGSETGIVDVADAKIVAKGRLGPGQMLAVDTKKGVLLVDDEIKRKYSQRQPYRTWVDSNVLEAPGRSGTLDSNPIDAKSLERTQRIFGYSREVFDWILGPMSEEGRLPIASMGDDTPAAVLSEQPQLLYRFFKQRFAQVTNPPIDSLRERSAFSLETMVGAWSCVLDEVPEAARLIRFASPLLDTAQFEWLTGSQQELAQSHPLNTTFRIGGGPEALERRLETIKERAEAAVDSGAALLILSDRTTDPDRAPVPMLLATSTVHHHLIKRRKRMQVSLICDSGEPREDHHVACLIGYGATLVHPYLALATVVERAVEADFDPVVAVLRLLSTLEEGLLKIMGRLGVGPISSYQGAQLFEALGLDSRFIRRYFAGTPSLVGGAGLPKVAEDVATRHLDAWGETHLASDRGLFRFRKGGEHHGLNPKVFTALHRAVRSGNPTDYQAYVGATRSGPPISLSDLLEWQRVERPLELTAVEPSKVLVRRFRTAAMSHGAISREAHEALAVAMNRLGAKSNSGEGGEALERFAPYGQERPRLLGQWQPAAGDWANSAIKQVASGRFGVTAHYLQSGRELEIKIAQGSKPGEGGQIPGHKVTDEIAKQRHSVPGVALVSPPPHHDIYSIEDLRQLIDDLRSVHPEAQIGVKLVAAAGVGTIAAGVAKAGADSIQISGASGGTGASPLSSIRHAGMPWELGLAETHRVLLENGLRERVTLRVDGGFRTGRDVVIATLLGADEFGFGTVPLLALGCVMARQCHLDTCPVGVATQREDLRARFKGTPEHVVAFMLFVAEEVRLILAEMGVSQLREIVGRRDLLSQRPSAPDRVQLDLSYLTDPLPAVDRARSKTIEPEPRSPSLDQRLWDTCWASVCAGTRVEESFEVSNYDRSVGTRLAGGIARMTHGRGLPEGSVGVALQGSAGQSLGAFLVPGMSISLTGDAQDYVGKGMSGGEIVLRPPSDSPLEWRHSVIAGNTILYGATGGRLFAAGRVGERFLVRGSGAQAVIEGCGDHGCEYMTGGLAVILGATGFNFGAGMSGGIAYVYDENGTLGSRIHRPSVEVRHQLSNEEAEYLRTLVRRHHELTRSPTAQALLADWVWLRVRFTSVSPRVH
jgi:glutamate synthase domain-containing protein 2/glutamate synthase domain-containing protein 1/glutamate synthase domain-containing protein 3